MRLRTRAPIDKSFKLLLEIALNPARNTAPPSVLERAKGGIEKTIP